MENTRLVKISPSHFAFLYKDCKRCFWLTFNRQITQPSKPMASIFTKIDSAQKKAFVGKNLKSLSDKLPDGELNVIDFWCESKEIEYKDLNLSLYIKGCADGLIKTDSGYCVIDFKTSDSSHYAKLYSRQLHAYAYAINNPVNNTKKISQEINSIGLIIFDPNSTFEVKNDVSSLNGDVVWKPFDYYPDKFEKFLRTIAETISLKECPDYTETCEYCKRDKIMKENGDN